MGGLRPAQTWPGGWERSGGGFHVQRSTGARVGGGIPNPTQFVGFVSDSWCILPSEHRGGRAVGRLAVGLETCGDGSGSGWAGNGRSWDEGTGFRGFRGAKGEEDWELTPSPLPNHRDTTTTDTAPQGHTPLGRAPIL